MVTIPYRKFFSSRLLKVIIFFILINILSKCIHFLYKLNRPVNYFSKYRYLAVIIDDRASFLVVHAVVNVLRHIPLDWKVQMITLRKNWLFYNQSSLDLYIKTNRVFLTSLEQSSNGLSSDQYINPILTSPAFWREVQGEIVLLFQFDSVLCSNSSWTIMDFLDYDFIGAPWAEGGCCNGGLSIRNRTKILQMLESPWISFYPRHENEDFWFTNILPSFNGRVAPISLAKKFSVETIYQPQPFGVHKPLLKYLGWENMTKLCQDCPEVRSISSHCSSESSE